MHAPAQKNSLVVVEMQRSFTDRHMKVRRYPTYFIGRATSVTGDGLVLAVRRPKGDKVILGQAHNVYAVNDAKRQAQLVRLADSLASDSDNHWTNIAALKNQILNA